MKTETHRKLRWALVAFAVASAMAIPMSYSTAGGLLPRRATCQSGTCCSEPGSDCIIGKILTENSYTLPNGGSCTKEEQKPTNS